MITLTPHTQQTDNWLSVVFTTITGSLYLFLKTFHAVITFLFSCLSFMNIRCLLCLFFISDTLKVGGKTTASASLFSISSSFTSQLSPVVSSLKFFFFVFFFLKSVTPLDETSVKSILVNSSATVFLYFLTCFAVGQSRK